jgi:hypothetical protein
MKIQIREAMMTEKSHLLTSLAKQIAGATLLIMAATNANAVAFTFTSITEELLDSQNTFFVNDVFSFDMTNNTGEVWNDFHLRAEGDSFPIGTGPYPFMRLSDYTGPGTASFADNDSDPLNYLETLNIDDLVINDGDTLSFSVNIFGGAFPEGMAAYRVYGLPSVDGNGEVPVPATLALLGLGLAGIGYRKKVRR